MTAHPFPGQTTQPDVAAAPQPATAAASPLGATATTARALTAASVLLSAVVHLELWALGMDAVPIIGPAFLVNAVGGLVIALAVLLWRSALPLLASIAFGVATLGAYIMSITVGLFGIQEEPGGVAATLSAVSEVTAVLFALVALLAERRAGRAAQA
ncbi:hypothetical protein [Actinotalea subterranea]|uniref:hypothetical protein n=1 Tax=Actinotalea subterranea TaxID=2607497 RepID=UPI001CAA8490|nr:hypothetical protein [Actinotalea subterranea]